MIILRFSNTITRELSSLKRIDWEWRRRMKESEKLKGRRFDLEEQISSPDHLWYTP